MNDNYKTFEDWLEAVEESLGEQGYLGTLDAEDTDWLYDVWNNYYMPPYDTASSFLAETNNS